MLKLVRQCAGHLVSSVLADADDAAVQSVDMTLRFPPAPGVGCSAGLGALPAGEAALGLVIGFGVFPDLSCAVGGGWVDAGIDGAAMMRLSGSGCSTGGFQ